jgi:hypothetical protein
MKVHSTRRSGTSSFNVCDRVVEWKVGDDTSRLVRAQDWETGMASTLTFDKTKRNNEALFDESKGRIRRTLGFEAGVCEVVRLRLGLADFQLRFLQQVSDEKGFTSGVSANLEIFLFLLLLSRAGTHLDLTTTIKLQ